MPTKPQTNVDLIDAEIATICRRYSVEAIATLIACCRDDDASASAKAAAATKLLEFGGGRPGIARQITTADISAMSDDQRVDLLRLLVEHYFPDDGFQDALRRLYGDLIALPAKAKKTKTKQAAKPVPKTNRFHRSPPKPKRPAHHPPDWDDPGYKRPAQPSEALPPDARQADRPPPTAAHPEQAPAGAAQGGDPRLAPVSTIGQLRYGLADDLPLGSSLDAYGNIVPSRWRH
jgi:hypothetical protein